MKFPSIILPVADRLPLFGRQAFTLVELLGGYRYHRHSGVFAPACSFEGKVGGSQSGLHQ